MSLKAVIVVIGAIALLITACSGNGHREQSREGPGEHSSGADQQAGHDQGQQGEESATQYERSDTYDQTRNGARLILRYDDDANAFIGSVENTTERGLTRVRVEVHLSNGAELGPTPPRDLDPGQRHDISLPATEASFDTWNAHPEVGAQEANHQSDRE